VTRLAKLGRRIVASALVLAVACALTVNSCGTVPVRPEGNRLPDCPGSPNCVNSQDSDADHRVEPLAFDGDPDQAWARLREVVLAMPRTTLVDSDDRYMHVVFRTAILRFSDDVQLMLDEGARVIHLRSASRLGYSDMGANRKRVDALRSAWEAASRDGDAGS